MSRLSDFCRWDIWIARVAFEDAPEVAKIRPVLVVDEKENYVLSVKITSHSPRSEFAGEYSIRYWQAAGLLKPSTIRLTKRLSLPKEAFIKKIGILQKADIENIESILQH